jgi:Rrf2 family transcriptional regulator, cysteine metabolism repressor
VKLSTKVRYGLRAVIELALGNEDEPMLIETIAKRQEVSKKYLENLLVTLRSSGLVRSIRGSKGGYVLARHPEDITVREVVEAFEGPLLLADCIDGEKNCPRSAVCVTQEVWSGLSLRMAEFLGGITLDTLVAKTIAKNEDRIVTYDI